MSMTAAATTQDRDILTALAAGDPQALELIWNRHANHLLGYLMSILNAKTDAEDVLQEVMVSIARKHLAVAKADALRPYLFRMARNQAMDFIRRNRHDHLPLDGAADRWLAAPEVAGHDADLLRQLAAALQALPEEQRSVIVLKIYQDRTFREIAELLDLSENTAASRYRYGMDKLKHLMGSEKP